ncbi:hypothetical protein PHYSODRAFT_326080 [Phytophthora sojae]|uniref:Uncharacterized protein n=1 Tax=Phytophthora sojae (strain P6497) TaxID=1094619 RepID=G4YX28_PHYSP|nr:hypothetical protein PHYSODRAFT_326080 [Phytophthora sojae]EGZ25035.1 hypothetical protein PHYSODRAFT_326080 [Phytophthora sojae]|eukprot:XP_009520323.1 hypothetical protein PHYSODRAFT_326080 [Phytophthora sojae]
MASEGEDMRDAGRESRERGDASRKSRRSKGLPPEEHASLDERKVAREEKESVSPAEQDVEDAHQVSTDGEPGVDATATPDGASVGGADVDEPQTEGRVSDSSPPGQDGGQQPDARASAREESLPSVPEEKSGQDADALPPPEEKACRNTPPKSSVEKSLGQDAAKAYVSAQVSLWEQVRSEHVLPPCVEYTWPDDRPDSLPWLNATLATSKYLAARATLGNDVQPCVLELRLDRRDLATAQDVVAVEISVAAFTSRECTHASKIAPDLVRSLAGDIQHLLTVELIEWRTLYVGASFKVIPVLETKAKSGQTPALDYHAEDQDGDLLMDDYEINQLGRNYVLRLRGAGIRSARSSSGSSAGEPTTKRRQHRPPRAEPSLPDTPLASLPSELPPSSTSAQEDSPEVPASDPVPSLVGTTDESAGGATAGSYVSKNRSSASSSSTLDSGAGAHMPLSGPLALSARAAGTAVSGGELGFYLTRQVIPERKVVPDQDDVDMADAEVAANVRSARTSSSRNARKHRDSGRSSSSSESDSDSDWGRRSSRHRRSSKRSSRRRSPSRRSSRSGHSGKSGRAGSSISSGAAEAAVSALHQVQMLGNNLESMREELAAKEKAAQDVEVRRALTEAERRIREAEERARETERRFQAPTQEAPGMSPTEVAAAIQAASLQAVSAERERVVAAAMQWVQQQQTEADAKREVERAAWAAQAQRNLEEGQAAMKQELKNMRATSKNMQVFQNEQIRNLLATVAGVVLPVKSQAALFTPPEM